MKKIAFLIFTIAAAVIAEKDDVLQMMADKFQTTVETVQLCISDAGTNIEELDNMSSKWPKSQDDDIDEETKQTFARRNHFITCMLEKNGMIVDSKLVLDKILEAMNKQQLMKEHQISADVITECINTLNGDDTLNKETRASGLIRCFMGEKSAEEN